MHWTKNWAWKIYCFIFALITIGNAAAMFSSDSYVYVYYHILMAFHPQYILLYALAAACCILSLISLIPLFFYAFEIPFLTQEFWKWIFVLRVSFELTGHAFEIQLLKSVYYSDVWIVVFLAGLFLASIGPSYYACFHYAFRWDRLFPSR